MLAAAVKFWFWLDRLALIIAPIGFGIELLPKSLWGGIAIFVLSPLLAICLLNKNSVRTTTSAIVGVKNRNEPLGDPFFNIIILAMALHSIVEDGVAALSIMAIAFVSVDLIYWMLLSFYKQK